MRAFICKLGAEGAHGEGYGGQGQGRLGRCEGGQEEKEKGGWREKEEEMTESGSEFVELARACVCG